MLSDSRHPEVAASPAALEGRRRSMNAPTTGTRASVDFLQQPEHVLLPGHNTLVRSNGLLLTRLFAQRHNEFGHTDQSRTCPNRVICPGLLLDLLFILARICHREPRWLFVGRFLGGIHTVPFDPVLQTLPAGLPKRDLSNERLRLAEMAIPMVDWMYCPRSIRLLAALGLRLRSARNDQISFPPAAHVRLHHFFVSPALRLSVCLQCSRGSKRGSNLKAFAMMDASADHLASVMNVTKIPMPPCPPQPRSQMTPAAGNRPSAPPNPASRRQQTRRAACAA